jgi:hypothetical protein
MENSSAKGDRTELCAGKAQIIDIGINLFSFSLADCLGIIFPKHGLFVFLYDLPRLSKRFYLKAKTK